MQVQTEEAGQAQRRAIMATRLNDERAIIFSNLLNGVPVWQVARDFHKQADGEVQRIFDFILAKIKSYCFERKLPPVLGSTVAEVRQYKAICFEILPKINLDKEPMYGKIFEEKMSLTRDGTFTHQDVLRNMKA